MFTEANHGNCRTLKKFVFFAYLLIYKQLWKEKVTMKLSDKSNCNAYFLVTMNYGSKKIHY